MGFRVLNYVLLVACLLMFLCEGAKVLLWCASSVVSLCCCSIEYLYCIARSLFPVYFCGDDICFRWCYVAFPGVL